VTLAYCLYCKRTLDPNGSSTELAFTWDHIYPAAYGGKKAFPCCKACNELKGDMLPDLWDHFRRHHAKWWTLYGDQRLRGQRLYAAWILARGDVPDEVPVTALRRTGVR
jgi:hypothetical protein